LSVPPLAPAGAGWTAPTGVHSQTGRWIGEGWRLVKADLGVYIVLALLTLLLGGIVPVIVQGPLFAGFHIFCMKRLLGRHADIADLFTGFNFFVPALVVSLLTTVLAGIGFLLCIIPGLVLYAMYLFAYLFVVDKRMDFWPAMQASHGVVRNDYVGFTLFVLALGLLNLLGLLLCVVGVLVTVPISFAAITVAYKEIVGFEPRTVESL
jgi:uncharacterized membrane protein